MTAYLTTALEIISKMSPPPQEGLSYAYKLLQTSQVIAPAV